MAMKMTHLQTDCFLFPKSKNKHEKKKKKGEEKENGACSFRVGPF